MNSNDARAVRDFARGETAAITSIPAKRQSWRCAAQHPREAKPTSTLHPDSEPGDETLKAVAQLIAKGATMATIDRDFAVICNLLHQECGWNGNALDRLGKVLSAELHRRDTSTVVAMPLR